MAERGAQPNVPKYRRRALKAIESFFSPLLPDDYLELINPLWSTQELRGRIERIHPEADGAVTVVIKPGYKWGGHRPGPGGGHSCHTPAIPQTPPGGGGRRPLRRLRRGAGGGSEG